MLRMKTMSTVVVVQIMQLMKSTGTRISSKSSVPDNYNSSSSVVDPLLVIDIILHIVLVAYSYQFTTFLTVK